MWTKQNNGNNNNKIKEHTYYIKYSQNWNINNNIQSEEIETASSRRQATLRLSNQLLRDENVTLQSQHDQKDAELERRSTQIENLQVEVSDLQRSINNFKNAAQEVKQLQIEKDVSIVLFTNQISK